MNFVVLFCLPLLVSSILRGDETQKLHDERVRVREQMESHAEGSEEHTLLKRKFHLLQHKVRALDLFEHGMSQQEYDELIRLVERRDELQARHDRDNFDPTERLEFNEVSHKIKDIMDKYKQIRKQNYANDPEIKAERDKVVELRKRIAETNDRDEMMTLRAELDEIYSRKPKLTSFGQQRWRQKRQKAEKSRKNKRKVQRFPHMNQEQLDRVTELRQRISETEDRDELFRLRQALKYERDQAAAAEHAQRRGGGR